MTASLALLFLYGLAVGISLGLTGGGGSIITVPLLVYLVGEPVHTAIATSLVIVGSISLIGFAGRLRQADTFAGFALGLAGFFGAAPGRIAAEHFSGRTLLFLFALIMVVASVAMFRSQTYAHDRAQPRRWLLIFLGGAGIGFLTGLLGVGGGFLIVPVLVLLLGMPMRSAIPTSLLVIGMNCLASLAGLMLLRHRGTSIAGTIDWHVAAFFLAGGIGGNLVGAAIARAADQRALKRIFAVFVFCVGMFVAASASGLVPLAVK
ncbi:MAG: sulfite exporter TauE/SafE family protein [Candidatus Eremiobacter antarcticus]|nr:sulfite exporter TauE/SafE family protein [Candidatus Eremiobacteraeota bacterium]MBC5807195.1 sulfite exporter TauE/SafE family protein [Candidatus Eremiobacteraeota bacterium]PZR60982.1 MAG: sulfite exporter TauE/SafE family protein [Candidatus Eremiobacter sp. RRmetagenome_bin22]